MNRQINTFEGWQRTHREYRSRSTASANKLTEILARADVRVDGGRPFDIQVHDDRFHDRVLSQGSLGAGESYMDGCWGAERVDQSFARIHRAELWIPCGSWSSRVKHRERALRSGYV